MRKVVIIVDDFKIGGIQRIALDQAYALNENGIKATIVVLSSKPQLSVPSFIHTEKPFIENLNVSFLFLDGSKYKQFKGLLNFLKDNTPELLICYSLRGTVLSFICKRFTPIKIKVVTVIEQLLSMSAPIQRVRRVFYSQFTDVLFAYSVAVKNDWDYRRKHNPFIWVISSRKLISVCRNGVFLPRIEFNQKEFTKPLSTIKRLIFVNRLTAWKGLPIMLRIIESEEFSETKLLLITPNDPKEYLADLEPTVQDRIMTVVGKSVSQVDFHPGDLHIYPASYGPKSRFIEAISINVLEMACFGVKSFVTEKGEETWPELVKNGMIYGVNWSDLPSVIKTILKNGMPAKIPEVNAARHLIDVKNNLNEIFEAAGFGEFSPVHQL